ncbi:MAG: methyltransferase domain-containing protein [Gammaproteobacteria bacterium]|jgi:ubiquinone/menaquinone biosynthesis C-methylase UbiE|nr:methyltransferase domain-containing protein [Gammaproteobacteria bacterium]
MDKYDSKAAARIDRTYQTPEIVNQRLRTLAALGLRRGESILDAGCGTGLLLEQEALAVGSAGRAEGVDASADMLTYAEVRCEGLDQVNLQRGNADSLPFDAACFDALSCTQVLLYVERLEQALTEFHRVLKPRGRIAIVETDWGGAIMNSGDHEMTQAIFQAWSDEVANPYLPRRLAPLLRDAGFGGIQVEAIPLVNASYTENSYSAGMLKGFANTAVRLQALSRTQADAWLVELEALAADDEYFFCVNRFLFTAIK